MQLTKRIPARTKTITFEWLKQEFMEMSDNYRTIRASCSSRMDSCWWCKHKFKNGEMMALGCVREAKANKVFCQSCIANVEEGD